METEYLFIKTDFKKEAKVLCGTGEYEIQQSLNISQADTL